MPYELDEQEVWELRQQERAHRFYMQKRRAHPCAMDPDNPDHGQEDETDEDHHD